MLDHLVKIGAFLGSMWAVFLLGPPWLGDDYGLIPGEGPLVTIVAATFLHGDEVHIIGNTVTIALLLVGLVLTHPQPWLVVAILLPVEGALLWFLGEPGSGPHIGASGLLFALVGFLLARAASAPSAATLAVAALVAWDFAPSLISSITPAAGPDISWESHLFGFLAGIALGLIMRERGSRVAFLPS